MAGWQRILARVASDVEHQFDRLKQRLDRQLGANNPIKIVAYYGYGTPEVLQLTGRVLEDQGGLAGRDNDSIWDNLVNMYLRFDTDEVVGARLVARFHGVEQEVVTDEEGYFAIHIQPERPLSSERMWHEVELELLQPLRPGRPPVRATGRVLVPAADAKLGIISDIDDTVVRTHAKDLLLMARTVFLGNAHTRLPFEGVAAFYRALHAGAGLQGHNPLFYVSSSPWNLYDLLCQFFELHNIPVSAFFLRDWGIDEKQLVPTRHHTHKLQAISSIMSLYPHLPFILIGDSGQQDPEIYEEIVKQYPERVEAVYIRNVTDDPQRAQAVRTLAERVVAAGSSLLLVDDTYTAAEHAAAHGWIAPELLPDIQAARDLDRARPSPAEVALSEEEQHESPAEVSKGQSSDEATPAADDAQQEAPPTVRVEGARRRQRRRQQKDDE